MTKRLVGKLLALMLVGALNVVLIGCVTHVAPWERGNLAKPHMALDPEPTLSVLREHVHVSKEASSGGTGTSGGGCGCN